VAYVPAVYESFSTSRLLVMEYIEGAVRMTDVDALQKRLGLDVNKVMNSVCEVFAAQVFRWGFVNADPHVSTILVWPSFNHEMTFPLQPSNVLIRRHPSNPKTHQVILLDHGLSIPLPPKFRMEYLQLWKSIFTNDTETMYAVCKAWGVDLGEDGLGAQMLGSTILLQNWSGSSRRSRSGGDRRMRRNGANSTRGGSEAQQKLSEEERKKRDLERQRAMKATVKRFLQNYELIPKVRVH
jgi:aarF domain-containing kinase